MSDAPSHHVTRPTDDPAWILSADGFDPVRERSRESRFSISNGFLGVRGGRAINRASQPASPPRTYVAGLFDIAGTEQPTPGLVSAADWLLVSLTTPAGFLVHAMEAETFDRRTIDFRRGCVLDETRSRDRDGLTSRLEMLRLASASVRSIGLQLVRLSLDRADVPVTLTASFAGMAAGLRLERNEQDLATWSAPSGRLRLAMACAPELTLDEVVQAPALLGGLTWSWTWTSRPGQVACFSRLVAVTLTAAGPAPALRAEAQLGRARAAGWRAVLASHEEVWANRWTRCDVTIRGDPDAQRAVRFASYHLNSAADPINDRVSIGARALTGEDYRGHVFWDTEIFLLPFYSFTWPDAARTLLHYRFATLDAARAKATRLGSAGAFYAWESADTGDDATPEQVIGPDRQVVQVLCGTEEQHISADVAYAVWHHWVVSGDDAFLRDEGAEIVLETARFWCSRARLGPDGRRHIGDVIGPDEYHEHVADNAYTNVMARWNIRRAMDVASLFAARWPERWTSLSTRIRLGADEIGTWPAIADDLVTGFDTTSGLYEQFRGFFALERIDLGAYAGRTVPMDVVLGRERTERSQVVKQADVVALLALLPGEFPGDSGGRNFRFYEPLCGHGSSLSPALHGLCAARLGDTDAALGYFHQAAAIDLCDTTAAIDGGIHIAAQGGIWMLAVFGFGGLVVRDDALSIEPNLPSNWEELAFPFTWRGRQLRVTITHEFVDVALAGGAPMTLTILGQPCARGSTATGGGARIARPSGRDAHARVTPGLPPRATG